jgi:release factor glutamine methyltransferase
VSIKIQTLGDIRKYFSGELSLLYPSEEIDSIFNIIVQTLFKKGRILQSLEPEIIISDETSERFSDIILQLKTGRPVQYILGETIFYNSKIAVNENVLIPRQETEELVSLIIKENNGFKGRIVDFGTGSGCIAVALGRHMPDAAITALDISEKAIETAKINAAQNNVKIEFLRADILNLEINKLPQAQIIVSNPPYVRESEKVHMHINVLEFEPHTALFVPDEDPLVFYRKILGHSSRILLPRGKIYFEINEAMGNSLSGMMKGFGFKDVSVLKDLNNKERIIKGVYYGG